MDTNFWQNISVILGIPASIITITLFIKQLFAFLNKSSKNDENEKLEQVNKKQIKISKPQTMLIGWDSIWELIGSAVIFSYVSILPTAFVLWLFGYDTAANPFFAIKCGVIVGGILFIILVTHEQIAKSRKNNYYKKICTFAISK